MNEKSKTHQPDLIVAALLAVPSQAPAQGGRARGLVVSHDSFGPVKIGMTLPQASRALGVRVTRDAGYEGDDCYYATPKGAFKGVAFMMAGARIVRIDVESGNYTTDKGAKIGDSEARIKRLYKGGYKVSRHKYFDAGRYIEVEIKGGRYSIIFETDGRRVTTYRVGRPPEEVYRIRKENVHLDQGYLFNPYGKTKAAKRKVPLSEVATVVLMGRLAKAKGNYLLAGRMNRKGGDRQGYPKGQ